MHDSMRSAIAPKELSHIPAMGGRVSTPAYSIIIPAYNAQATLGDCLKALQTQSTPRGEYEVIVVDDGSTDATAEVARSFDTRLLCQDNTGPAAARNHGARAARGSILLFTDADCVPAYDWLERISEPLRDPEVTGAKGIYRTRQRVAVARFVQLEYEDRYARMSRRERIDFVDTYSAAYRRETFLANGGFDTTFPTASVEDQELSFRLARKGYWLVFAPQAVVYHHHDATVGEYWRRKFAIGYWKALLLRWHPGRAVTDSHTPQVLKVQIGLAGLLGLLLPLTLFWSFARYAALIVAGIFCCTAVPFLARVLRRDPAIAVIVPLLLVLRSLALGSGLVTGTLSFAGQPSPHPPPISLWDRIGKRTMDIVGSLLGLALTSPLLAVLALAVRLDSPGPICSSSQRIGRSGHLFTMRCLRTTARGREPAQPGPTDPNSLPSRTSRAETGSDANYIGRFLRRTGLDALPQLWNVLVGEMSLVGPVPEEGDVAQRYDDWHRQRLAIRPGMTGPSQVSERGALGLDERVRMELDYIEHYSLWRDMCILFRAVATALSGRSAP